MQSNMGGVGVLCICPKSQRHAGFIGGKLVFIYFDKLYSVKSIPGMGK